MAFWGIEIKPGKPYVHQYDDERGRLHVSQATLGSGSSKEKAVVVCNVGDKKPIFLCSLFPKRMETCSLNVEFEEYDEVTFSVEGCHSVHLSGFFHGEKPDSDGDDYDSDSYEDGIFEEESDSEDYTDFDTQDEEDDLTDNDMDMYPSSPKANSGVRIEEMVDDDKAPNENAIPDQSKKRNNQAPGNDNTAQQQIVVKRSSAVPVLESEDEDGFPISKPANSESSGLTSKGKAEESIAKGKDGLAMRNKLTGGSGHMLKRKKTGSVFVDDPASEPEDVSTPAPEVDVKKAKKKNKKARTGEKDKLEAGSNSNSKVLYKDERNQEQTSEKVAEHADSIAVKTVSEEKNTKKDKKKNKQPENTAGAKVELNAAERNGSATEDKPFQVRAFPNGLIVEELQMGKPNGKRACRGKKVSVHYIGKLKKTGKIFDSNIRKAPFKFTLGVGQVIRGWDIGINGMRVGDKRRLTIPPSIGYGCKGAGEAIPPNAWLIFEVELVHAS